MSVLCDPLHMAQRSWPEQFSRWCPNFWHLKHLSGSGLYVRVGNDPKIPRCTLVGIGPMKVVSTWGVCALSLLTHLTASATLCNFSISTTSRASGTCAMIAFACF